MTLKKAIKKALIPLIFCLLLFSGYSIEHTLSSNDTTTDDSEINTSIITELDNLGNGDAKFFNDNIITSLNGYLTLFDLDGNEIASYTDIESDWISCISDEGIIIYANSSNEVGIAQLDDDNNLISNEVIFQTENLQIDPTIINVNGVYYITLTEIVGTANNSDPDVENGYYTIHLYKSDDLENWEFVSDIASGYNNLEDVDIFYQNDKFYVCYEKEVVDKGDSSILIAVSTDSTATSWNDPIELLSANCDHEPAAIVPTDDDQYILYYSCDLENVGESYTGAEAYYAVYDSDFNCTLIDQKINTETSTGILLYDVLEEDDNILFLYAKDYLTDRDLIVEETTN